jgi:hypothetical protein
MITIIHVMWFKRTTGMGQVVEWDTTFPDLEITVLADVEELPYRPLVVLILVVAAEE